MAAQKADISLGSSGKETADALMSVIEETAWERDVDQKATSLTNAARRALRQAISSGAVYDAIQNVSPVQRSALEDELRDTLTREEWSVGDVSDDLMDIFGWDRQKAVNVARNEVVSISNWAREFAYRQDPAASVDERRFEWIGPQDWRTTDCCEHIKRETEGGVPMDDLIEYEREGNQMYFPDMEYRRHHPHINCRHTFVEIT